MGVIDEAAALIRRSEKIAIATHITPDPDAAGSLLGLGCALKSLDKKVIMLCDDPVPSKVRFLWGSEEVAATLPGGWAPDLLIGVDASDPPRLGIESARLIESNLPVLNIDHHVTNVNFGTVNLVAAEAASTTEALIPLLDCLDVSITVEIANCLLVGLIGDTRNFSTSSVTPNTLMAAARLVSAGANIAAISEQVLGRQSLGVLKLWELGFKHMKLERRVLWTIIPLNERESAGISEIHDSGLANILLSAQEADVAVVFTEQPDKLIEVSMRARPGYDVAQAALKLGGGGHPQAAGCRITGDKDRTVTKVLETVRAQNPNLG